LLDLPIVDAHVHLWELPKFPRPWLGSLPALNRSYDLENYQEQTGGLPISGLVYVETAVAPPYSLLEARWAISLAETDPRLQAVVAAAPLDDGLQVRPYLEALAALGPLVKGVRRNLQDERDPKFCLRRDFVAGVRLLETYGFSFDACVRHDQLPAVTELVRECPAVSFVVDHLGKPAIRERQLDPWRDQLAALAQSPNVACKLSGLVTEADWQQWRPEDLAPYVTHALDVFGPDRVLFGSDWPVMTLASSYRRWVETLDELTSHLSAEDRQRLWSDNTCHWYRLPFPVHE
jgi:L-fuconolactonase